MPISQRDHEIILEAQGNQCNRCGSSDLLSLHHILPQSKGGTDSYDNIMVLCEPCHAYAHGMVYKHKSNEEKNRKQEERDLRRAWKIINRDRD